MNLDINLHKSKRYHMCCLSEVPQPPSDGDKPGMCAALQKPGILVALFKVP